MLRPDYTLSIPFDSVQRNRRRYIFVHNPFVLENSRVVDNNNNNNNNRMIYMLTIYIDVRERS